MGRDIWQQLRRLPDPDIAKKFKGARWALLKNPQDLTDSQAATLAAIRLGLTNARLEGRTNEYVSSCDARSGSTPPQLRSRSRIRCSGSAFPMEHQLS